MGKIQHPHDHFFKSVFKRKEVTIDFLKGRLAPDVLAKINLETLALTSASFVDEQLKAFHSDLVFSLDSKQGGKGYLYCILEQQTRPDISMSLRLMEYNVKLYRQHWKEGYRKLPFIINFVLYTGTKAWPYEHRLRDAFENQDALFSTYHHPYLVDLSQADETALLRDGRAALIEWIYQAQKYRDYCKFLEENPMVVELMNQSSYGVACIMYILSQEPHQATDFLKKVPTLSKSKKTEIMNALDRIKNEGMQQGIQQTQTQMLNILNNLLTPEQVAEIKKSLKL